MLKMLTKVAAVTLCVCSFSAYSWNSVGHMVVANIAYQHLKPNVQKKVDNLTSFLHKEYPEMESFVHISYWADAIRSQKIDTYTHWHYIDIPFSADGTELKNTIDTDNAVWAVNAIEQVVKNDRANNYERARFLAFLVHIVADLHQPLHTTTRITAAHPDGDRGGNLFHVRFHGDNVSLHKVWDEGVGEFNTSDKIDNINTLSATITKMYPENSFGNKAKDVDPDHWSKEGFEIAKKYVYNTAEDQPVSTAYIENGRKTSEQQAALAGYRLANLLNTLLG